LNNFSGPHGGAVVLVQQKVMKRENKMKELFNPFPKVSWEYGAPMGRVSANLGISYETDTVASLAVAGPAYEYDAGGVFWGFDYRSDPIWAVWRRGKGREGVVYVRARNANHARSLLLCAPQ
jgi:hypothetical protein